MVKITFVPTRNKKHLNRAFVTFCPLPFRTVKCLYQETSCFTFPFGGLIFNCFFSQTISIVLAERVVLERVVWHWLSWPKKTLLFSTTWNRPSQKVPCPPARQSWKNTQMPSTSPAPSLPRRGERRPSLPEPNHLHMLFVFCCTSCECAVSYLQIICKQVYKRPPVNQGIVFWQINPWQV